MNGSPFLSRVPASADGDHHLTGPALARISRLASICDARRGCRGWCGSCPADGSVSVRKIVIEVVLQRRDPLEAPSHPLLEALDLRQRRARDRNEADVALIEVDGDAVEIVRPERAVRHHLFFASCE